MKFCYTFIIASIMAVTLSMLGGCAAIGTSVSHRNLQTQTEMSNSIFLTPVAGKQRSVYVQVQNTTGMQSFNLNSKLIGALSAKGYQVYTNPADVKKAHYLLQVSVLRVGKFSQTAAEKTFGTGYGGALEGAAAGAVIGGLAGGDTGSAAIGGLVGAIGGAIIDNAVKDVTYSGVVNVRIVEQAEHKIHTTRIATSANKVNLDFHEAEPELETRLASSIAGLFS